MGMFKPLAWLSALAAMWVSVPVLGSPGAIVGTAAGELVYLIGLVALLVHRMRRHRDANQVHPGTYAE